MYNPYGNHDYFWWETKLTCKFLRFSKRVDWIKNLCLFSRLFLPVKHLAIFTGKNKKKCDHIFISLMQPLLSEDKLVE